MVSFLKKVKVFPEKLIKLFDSNFFYFILFLIFIGVIRNSIELIGFFSGSLNYSGYFPVLSSFLDTISYVFLMIIAEGFLINKLFGGTKSQLRELVHKGSLLLFCLFITIPLLNNIFNYHIFYFPISYNLGFIHSFLDSANYYMANHYGPVGINIAFLIVMFGFPFWLKKFYKSSLLKSFLIVWPFYIIHYIVTYQIMINLSWGHMVAKNILLNFLTPLNAYTLWFVVLTLIVYPFFMKDYPKNEKEKKLVFYFFIILWLVLISLFFVGGPY